MIFNAGSLSVPFREIADAFRKNNPAVTVILEASGSRSCARKISDLDRNCDVFASADYTVINTLLVPDHAQWCIRFASNEMAIAYTEKSRRSNEFDVKNWYEIMLDDNISFGRADPNSDPCGYRSVLTLRLAQSHYEIEGLADHFLQKDRRYMRPKETDLLALLEAGAIDYIFIYRSVAEQHGLRYLLLPDAINLKDPSLAEFYQTVSVDVSGKEPGATITKHGAPMVYGVTIPNNAENPAAALAFLNFLLDKDKGMAIMKSNGQPSVVPAPSETYSAIPDELKRFAREE